MDFVDDQVGVGMKGFRVVRGQPLTKTIKQEMVNTKKWSTPRNGRHQQTCNTSSCVNTNKWSTPRNDQHQQTSTYQQMINTNKHQHE